MIVLAASLRSLHAVAAGLGLIAVGVGQHGRQGAAVHLMHAGTGHWLRSLDMGPTYTDGECPRYSLRITHDSKHVAVADAMSAGSIRLFNVADGTFVCDVAPPDYYADLEECADGWLAVLERTREVSYCRR